MPDASDPHGDGARPADLVPFPPVHHAEQALLGALLLQPHRLTGLPLAAAEFSTAAHTALFTAMKAVQPPDPAAHAKEPLWLNTVLDTARREARGLTASYLHTLISACPDPAHTDVYARMIREEHAHRTLDHHAAHLAQLATDPKAPGPVPPVLAAADTLARCLDEIAARFPPHPGPAPRTPLPPDPAPRSDDDVTAEERLLLACATAHPDRLDRVRWLLPEDLTVPLHTALYRCITTLHRRSEPIDPVTVLWAAQRHGLHRHPTDPAAVLDLLATPAGSVEHWAERALERSLLHQARTAAARIRALTADRANSPHQLTTGARRALAGLHATRTRFDRTAHPQTPATAPTSRSPAATPRAGPALRTTPPTSTARATR
ncbi:DnaB-like helicase N-terminal domain-containing protein [Streptomyces uncialis]|uniref:DnaB-like helicase N-terminal domain-containing protein n=1 Tax=Streptomyces uncialis TaxID=1048205 RepID=UPI0038660A74|nr:replicative DNA helicase [Streptomyces uncialis]